jgi:D-threo-aldose 1-dehydrogenase
MDICLIHDVDVFTLGKDQPELFKQAMDGAWRALESLRSQKVVKATGVGVNEWQVCHEALKQRDFDCFLLAGRFTLLEQDPLDEFLPLCQDPCLRLPRIPQVLRHALAEYAPVARSRSAE